MASADELNVRQNTALLLLMQSLRTIIRSVILASFALSAVGVSSALDIGERLPEAVPESLVRVLATPKEFVGRPIQVAGIFSWGFEEKFLFLTFDHYAMWDEESAISLALDDKGSGLKSSDLDAFKGYRVKLEGVLQEVHYSIAELEAARKRGLLGKPIYYFRFSRLLSYGPAGKAIGAPNQPPQPTPSKGG